MKNILVNPAKAKERYLECEADAKAALMTQNEEALQKTIADQECMFARQAILAHERRDTGLWWF